MSGDVCFRLEHDAQLGQRVVCVPTMGSIDAGENGGCPGDFIRGEGRFINKVYPQCSCVVYDSEAWAKVALSARLDPISN